MAKACSVSLEDIPEMEKMIKVSHCIYLHNMVILFQKLRFYSKITTKQN